MIKSKNWRFRASGELPRTGDGCLVGSALARADGKLITSSQHGVICRARCGLEGEVGGGRKSRLPTAFVARRIETSEFGHDEGASAERARAQRPCAPAPARAACVHHHPACRSSMPVPGFGERATRASDARASSTPIEDVLPEDQDRAALQALAPPSVPPSLPAPLLASAAPSAAAAGGRGVQPGRL